MGGSYKEKGLMYSNKISLLPLIMKKSSQTAFSTKMLQAINRWK